MSSTVGIVRAKGKIYRIEKTQYENDDMLFMRAWYCASQDKVDAKTVSDSHVWVNSKYLHMKYVETNGNRP